MKITKYYCRKCNHVFHIEYKDEKPNIWKHHNENYIRKVDKEGHKVNPYSHIVFEFKEDELKLNKEEFLDKRKKKHDEIALNPDHVLIDMWYQFAYEDLNGKKYAGGLSALEFAEYYLKEKKLIDNNGNVIMKNLYA